MTPNVDFTPDRYRRRQERRPGWTADRLVTWVRSGVGHDRAGVRRRPPRRRWRRVRQCSRQHAGGAV